MYAPAGVKSVHLELTTRCNARCPQCSRNVRGGRENPNLTLTELSVNDVMQIFSPSFLRQLASIDLCGNYGDASVVPDVLSTLLYMRECNEDLEIRLHTNGGARAAAFWADVAATRVRCIFAIDGLEDTNAIYRRGTEWRNIMRNATAFIDAGGNAEWTFVVFRHNQHQVAEAAALAKQLGFKRFTFKKSDRFFPNGKLAEAFPVHGLDGEFEYVIEPPTLPEYLNDPGLQLNVHVDAAQSAAAYKTYLDLTEVHCLAAREKKVFVSADGLVFPCCWTASIYPAQARTQTDQIVALINALPAGRASIDGRVHDINDIVAGQFFEQIERSWRLPSVVAGKLGFCARQCGDYNLNQAQKSPSLI